MLKLRSVGPPRPVEPPPGSGVGPPQPLARAAPARLNFYEVILLIEKLIKRSKECHS